MSEWDPIPGETPIDISGLKIKGITNRRDLNELEAENVRKAVTKYLGRQLNNRIAPFTYEWLLRLHKEMFGDVWQWAGLQRKSKLNLGCAPHLIPEQLGQLLGNLKSWTGDFKIPLAEQAAMLHHQAVAIHPFETATGGGPDCWPTFGFDVPASRTSLGLIRQLDGKAQSETSIWRPSKQPTREATPN
jgi:fido (protein-threonine AMPylation protein)